jgi:hypothetical protein
MTLPAAGSLPRALSQPSRSLLPRVPYVQRGTCVGAACMLKRLVNKPNE